MRLVFAGTPVFAAQALEALIQAGHQIDCVLTQPDRPAGRGMKLQASAVKQVAQAHGLPVLQPARLRSGPEAEQVIEHLRNPAGAGRPDVMVVAAYGLILPKSVLDIPVHGCLNIHASLLPRWRGAAPIQRAIQAGDSHTGITIMQMDEGLDTGDMCRVAELPIGNDNSSSLHDRLAHLGATEIVAALSSLAAGTLQRQPQPSEGVSYADKISKAEAWLDWSRSALELRNRIAAFDPFPGACTLWPVPGGEPFALKLFDAAVADEKTATPASRVTPGTVLAVSDQGLTVACGSGVLQIRSVQRPSGKRLPAVLGLQGLDTNNGPVLGGSPATQSPASV